MRHSVAAGLAALLFTSAAVAAPTKYSALQSTIKYSSSTPTSATGFKNFARATSTVTYNSATDTYTIRDTGSLSIVSSFAPADIDAGASDANFTVYDKSSGSTVETFRLLNPGAPLIALTYVDYGQWRRSTTASGTTTTNDTYLVFGSKTPKSAIPHSGSANYTTILDGTWIDKTGAYAVSGTGTFSADFLNGSIGYSTTATGLRESDSVALAFGTMTGTGSIAYKSATFNGNGTTNGSGYKMDLMGGFYGPSYEEIGGIARITGNGGNGEGAIVGN